MLAGRSRARKDEQRALDDSVCEGLKELIASHPEYWVMTAVDGLWNCWLKSVIGKE